MPNSKLMSTIILAWFLLTVPVSAQECLWSNVASGVVGYGRNLLKTRPNITDSDFRSRMTKQLSSAQTKHKKNCRAPVHSKVPAMFPGSTVIDDPELAEAVREMFLTPRSSYWQWVLL